MRKFIQRALLGAFIGGGIVVLGAGVANAADTSGDDGLLSGTQGLVSVDVPLTLSGNVVSVLGDSSSHDATTTTESPAPATPATTSGDDALASGSQALISVAVPVDLSGNAVSVIGDSESSGSTTTAGSAPAASATAPETSGDDSLAGGTQAVADVAVPVTVSGNAISVLGDSTSTDAATDVDSGAHPTSPSGTSGDDGILGGTQVIAPITAPVTASGNAISVIGDSTSSGSTTEVTTGQGTGTTGTTSGDDGILGGTQVIAPVTAPVTIGGNAISGIGDSDTSGATTEVTTGTDTGTGTTSGDDGILGGGQLVLPVTIPVTIGGNAVSVIGDSSSDSSTTVVEPTDPTDPTTPTDPTDPTTPTNPTDPTTPVTPTNPTDPTVPATPGDTDGGELVAGGAAVVGTTAAVGTSAAMASGRLAATGGEASGWLTLVMGFALIAGGAAAIRVRRRTV